MVTPPIFCAGYSANRSATASAHLPPKYPSCRGVTQDFAKSFSGQHAQPKYLSRRAAVMGKPTKELNGMSLTMLGMRHSFCRRPKRPANGPRSPSMSASLIGRLGSSTFRLSAATVSMSLTGSCFSSESAPRPFHHGIRRRGGAIFWSALPSDERQVQATKRTHLIHRPARDIIPPLGGSRVSSYSL